jgi:hypothetical protein
MLPPGSGNLRYNLWASTRHPISSIAESLLSRLKDHRRGSGRMTQGGNVLLTDFQVLLRPHFESTDLRAIPPSLSYSRHEALARGHLTRYPRKKANSKIDLALRVPQKSSLNRICPGNWGRADDLPLIIFQTSRLDYTRISTRANRALRS